MKRQAFCVTLLSDTVLSERPATSGGHKTLDYLPGAVFLGAVAGRLYARLGEQAWQVFHSGKIRFNNALPLDETGQLGLPMPLAFFRPKYAESDHVTALTNRSRIEWPQTGQQPKQCRQGFLTGAGKEINPPRGFRLKTAIDRNRGQRAKDGQLFGYQYLEAGSRWYFQLDCDADVSDALIEQVCNGLTTGGVRLGRSRSAEFGSVKVEPIAHLPLTAGSASDHRLLVYCLSDLAMRDPKSGMPSLTPACPLLGLPSGVYLPEWSHLRFRSYAPFNAYRGANDIERQVVSAGSVLAFELDQPLDAESLQNLQRQADRGIGDYRQDGLGRVWLNPTFLAADDFTPQPLKIALLAREGAVALSGSEKGLCDWLVKTQRKEVVSHAARTVATSWLAEIRFVDGGPSCSQWRKLGLIAQGSTDRTELGEKLFGVEGLCSHGVSQRQWAQDYHFDQSYRDFLEGKIKQVSIQDAEMLHGLAQFGRLAAAKLRQGGDQ